MGWVLVGCACRNEPAADACGDACGEHAYCDAVIGRCYCEVGSMGDPEAGCAPHDDVCADAEARVGHSVCALGVRHDSDWTLLSIGHGNNPAVSRGLKYLAPAVADARVPIVFGNTNWYRIHHCLLADGFAPLFPDTSYEDYVEIVIQGQTRELYGGTISELTEPWDDVRQFVFSVETLPREDELLSQEQIYGVYRQLQDRFPLGALNYVATQPLHAEQALAWEDPPFPIAFLTADAGPQYEAYTPGLAYGRVRRFTDAEFDAAGPAAFGPQDILVLQQPPLVVEGIMAASITTARQDVLTHLNVLSALRGTPNIKVANALQVFAPYEGVLVRLEALPTEYSVREASAAEADAFWAQQRPKAELNAPPDRAFTDLLDLDAMATATAAERTTAVSRFGAKASGVAVLRTVADPSHVVAGFGVPMSAYFSFMDDNSWEAAFAEGTEIATYADTLARWADEESFRTDAALRAERLGALRRSMIDEGFVDEALLAGVRTQITSVLGDANVMVRFRSSSNAEDSLSFNGAGLYDSVSGCGADTPGAPESLCEPGRKSKPIDTALKTVWASLWSFGAYEERTYYQLDHAQIGMGVLVNPRFADELANGVALTGNPNDLDDPRLTINVQLGEVPVVSANAGVVAELDRVRVDADGSVSIDREIASSLVAPGGYVLDDAQLAELALILSDVAARYPVDAARPAGSSVMLDIEFKLTAQGELVLKQVRPFAAKPYVQPADSCG